MRAKIASLVAAIEPHDALEQEHRNDTLAWIASDAPLFRIRKPDVPARHLVSYFALLDESRGRLLLVDHKNAGLWLPGGGHVEPNEDPGVTVARELAEELDLEASFLDTSPLFVTVTETRGAGRHTDVSLWYVLRGDSQRSLEFDAGEFHGVRWFGFDEIPFERSDPQMRRFVEKLVKRLAAS